jgi:hypothetical protein
MPAATVRGSQHSCGDTWPCGRRGANRLCRIAADDIKARGIALAAADIDGDFDCG